VVSRVGARLLTCPLAFLIGGLLDIATLIMAVARTRARRPAA
jgi:hypothetical protein